MYQPNIVVLGAGYAGLLSTLRLARKTQANITLVNAAPVFVERVRLHQQAAGQNIVQHSIPELLRGTNVNFVQGFVTKLDPEKRAIKVKTSEGEQTLGYDNLVYTLGSTIDQDSVEGVREFADVLTPDHTTALHQKLNTLPSGANLVICGGGLTGIESATEFAETYTQLKVTLVTLGEFGAQLSQSGRKHARKTFERLGITIQDNTRVERVEAKQIITDHGELAYDAVIWTGAFSVPALAREAGLQTNPLGQIEIDDYLRSVSHPEIYAAGDAAYPTGFQPHLRMACATALPMAMQMSDNLVARLTAQPEKPLHFRYYIRCISLGRHDGLIQMVDGNDSPHEMALTGRVGAFIKEQVCRFAFNTVIKENRASSKARSTITKPDTARVA